MCVSHYINILRYNSFTLTSPPWGCLQHLTDESVEGYRAPATSPRHTTPAGCVRVWIQVPLVLKFFFFSIFSCAKKGRKSAREVSWDMKLDHKRNVIIIPQTWEIFVAWRLKAGKAYSKMGIRTPFPQPTAGLGSSVLRGTGKATNAWRFE